MGAPDETMDAVRRKLNVTWDSEGTEGRIRDVVDAVTPVLNNRLGLPPSHEFSRADGMAFGLFLNACLYEWSDAIDDFWVNYAQEVMGTRLMVEQEISEAADAQD